MIRKVLFASLAILVAGGISLAPAQSQRNAGSWSKQASTRIDLRGGRAAISLGRAGKQLRAIRFRTRARKLVLTAVTIYFKSRRRQRIRRKITLVQNRHGGTIQLGSRGGRVTRVVVSYLRQRKGPRRTSLEIWGLPGASLAPSPPKIALPGTIGGRSGKIASGRPPTITAARPPRVSAARPPHITASKPPRPPIILNRPRAPSRDTLSGGFSGGTLRSGRRPASAKAPAPTTGIGSSGGRGGQFSSLPKPPHHARRRPAPPPAAAPPGFGGSRTLRSGRPPAAANGGSDKSAPKTQTFNYEYIPPEKSKNGGAPAPAAAPPPPPSAPWSGGTTRSVRPPGAPAPEPEPAAPMAMDVPAPLGDAAPAPLDDAAPAPHPLATKDYDVMPLFYGTDRQDTKAPDKQPVYGSKRAEKLQLGLALVTIPKLHEMPNVERPWSITLPLIGKVQIGWENPKKHFTIKQLHRMKEAEFLRLVKEHLTKSSNYKDQALVFIHGFNNSFEGALFRTAQIAFDLKFDGAPFVYSWPSAGSWTSYPYDRESASAARPYLKEFLQLVSQKSGAKKVSIIAHSMGTFALLNVLRDLKFAAPDSVKIDQIILAAPDIGINEFKVLAREIKGISAGITLYASANDRALYVSREYHGGVPRAGDVPTPNGPIIVGGIDSIDVSAISIATLATNHSSYAQTKELMDDIERLLKTGERPPQMRQPLLETVPGRDADGNPVVLPDGSQARYWRFPPPSQ